MNSLSFSLNNIILRFGSANSLSTWWTYGSATAIYIVLQVFSGLVLSIYVILTVCNSYDIVLVSSIELTSHEILRYVHANGCSVVFLLLLLHATNGVWFSSYHNSNLWNSGVLLLILVIGAAFLSYVIPWGNISLWGATVITNLISVVPYGDVVLLNVWGGFTLNDATLSRIFSLHFLLPLLVISVILVHLLLLHEYVSSGPSGLSLLMISFSSLLNNDLSLWLSYIIILSVLIVIPQYFMDADNWTPADFLVTPDHINPEWYFLFAYAILRCIPVKWVSVLSLVGSLVVILLIGAFNNLGFLLVFFVNFILLTYLGGVNVTDWYTLSSQFASSLYVISI